MEQPKRGDGEDAWRRYAADLRQQLGEVKGRLSMAAVVELDTRARIAEARLAGAKKKRKRTERVMNEIEADLIAGDVPAAVARLERRRRGIERREHYGRQ